MRIRACGLARRDGRVLLQRKIHETIWALPGGKVERGETPAAAVAREFREELGWDVRVGPQLWLIEIAFTHDGEDVLQMEVCFAVSCDAQITVTEETLEFRWVSAADIRALDVRPIEVCGRLFSP